MDSNGGGEIRVADEEGPPPRIASPVAALCLALATTTKMDTKAVDRVARNSKMKKKPGKGYHMATKEEAGCTIKVESMDAVHGRERDRKSVV